MARSNRHATPAVKPSPLAQGRRLSFYQALRLLARLGLRMPTGVQVRPELSMGFPPSDLAQVETLPDGSYRLTATFLGLYGTSSPLPAFYTEDLFQDAREDSSAVRDVLDLIHGRLYDLLYLAWRKYRLFVQVSEGDGAAILRMLYALTGIAGLMPDEQEGDDYTLIRYTGILGARPRSGLALETFLSDVLGGLPVEIRSCLPRTFSIPTDQRLYLGSDDAALGSGTRLGQQLIDIRGKFRVRIGPLTQHDFRSLLPGNAEWKRLQRLIKRFLIDPLDFDIELILAEGETDRPQLGAPEWSRLGLDIVLFTGRHAGKLQAVYAE